MKKATSLSALTEQYARAQAAAENNQFNEAIQLYTELLDVIPDDVASTASKQLRLDTLQARGDVLGLCQMPKAAIADYEQWRTEAGTKSELIDILDKTAKKYALIGVHAKAAELYQEALAFAQIVTTTPLQDATLHAGLGSLYLKTGRLEEADKQYELAIKLFEKISEKAPMANACNGYAISLNRQGKWDKSLAAYQKALEINRELGQSFQTAIVLSNMGEVYQQLFDLEQSYQYHQEALSMLTDEDKSRTPAFLCDLYRNIGIDLYNVNKVEEGVTYLERAQRVNESARNEDVTLQLLVSFAMAELKRGNISESQRKATACIEQAQVSGARLHKARALYILGLGQQAAGDRDAAEQTWQQTIFMAHETGQKMLLWRTHAALADNATTTDIARVHRQLAREIIQQLTEAISDESLRQKFLSTPLIQSVLHAKP